MDKRLIDIHHDYVHDHCDRRKFLEQAARIVGSTAAAAALLPVLDCNYALAQTVGEDDPRLETENVTFSGATGEINGYLAKPRAPGSYGAIVLVHEAGGLNPHTQDVARRLAAEGFVALGVDFLSPLGGTEHVQATRDPNGGNPIQQLDAAETVQDGIAAVRYLRMRDDVNGKVGVVGFCWGGRVTQNISITEPSLDAAVVYYGQPPHPSLAEQLQTPILMQYADVMLDMNNTGEAILYRAELDRLGKTYEFHMYEGAMHGFNNNTNTPRYNEAAAEIAWSRTLDWFRRYLS